MYYVAAALSSKVKVVKADATGSVVITGERRSMGFNETPEGVQLVAADSGKVARGAGNQDAGAASADKKFSSFFAQPPAGNVCPKQVTLDPCEPSGLSG